MTQDCIFCKIVTGEIPADIVYQDEQVTAFRDIDPQAPVHVLLVPNEHISSLGAVDNSNAETLGHLMSVVSQIAQSEGIAESGFRLVFNTGKDGGMAVHHLHGHILGGRQMGWPPG
ncbi:MAG: histidine triad nucleotide-binding protein [Chloroflexota bacterium]|nr:histidine triad nucleotide-binding protein [Chloroflexota bacterium]